MPGTPNYPSDMATEWQNMKRNVRNLFTSANYRRALQQIGATGLVVYKSLSMQAGSWVQFKYANGIDGMWFGRHVTGGNDADGMFVRRADGSIAFWIHSLVSGSGGFTALYDKNENIIFSDDGSSGIGIARPWLEHSFIDTNELTGPPANRQTTATTDTAVVTSIVPLQHSRMKMHAYVYNPGGGTNEVKVKSSAGTTLFTGSYAGTNHGFIEATFSVGNYAFGDTVTLDVTIRRSAGAGAVGITVLGLWGIQS